MTTTADPPIYVQTLAAIEAGDLLTAEKPTGEPAGEQGSPVDWFGEQAGGHQQAQQITAQPEVHRSSPGHSDTTEVMPTVRSDGDAKKAS